MLTARTHSYGQNERAGEWFPKKGQVIAEKIGRRSGGRAAAQIVVAALGFIEKLIVEPGIGTGAALPREARGHALILQPLPLVGRLEDFDRAADRMAKSLGRDRMELEAGGDACTHSGVIGIDDGFRKPAGARDDRDAPITQGIKLGEAAGLEARRLDHRVGAAMDEVGEPLVVTDMDGHAAGEARRGPNHQVLDRRIALAADDELGAAIDDFLGDIGEHFPDTDPRFLNLDSSRLLADTLRMLAEGSWTTVNCDIVIHAQAPKLTPYKPAIRANVARLLGVEPSRVNVKAKTGEHVGPVGRGEAIMCEAVALIEQRGL